LRDTYRKSNLFFNLTQTVSLNGSCDIIIILVIQSTAGSK